jgi:hypothetical protein
MQSQVREFLRHLLKRNTTEQKQPSRKPYVKPTVRQLTPEQAKLKLLGHATLGDKGANDLLGRMLRKEEKDRKKSA